MVSKVINSLVVASALIFSQSAYASPVSLDGNSSYDLSGSGVGSGEQFADNGGLFLAFYQSPHGNPAAQAGDFYVYMNLSGSATTGNISGNNLSSLDVNIVASLVSVVQYDGTAWNQVDGASGNATAHMNYSDLTLNPGQDIFALINNIGSGTGSMSTNLSFGGDSAGINGSIAPSFMPFDQTTQAYYDPAINAFSNNGILDFAMAGFNGGIHSWFENLVATQFGGITYFLQGDIHANYSESSQVPEPASLGLLTAGILGIINRRKKQVIA